MIPKIIHYCWFGKNRLPKSAKNCIRSWKTYCPGYKIIRWSEKNFDLAKAPLYVRQAYKAKKWAFVTDYVRLWCTYNFGGIYFDTDVELIKKIDFLLDYDAFFGFEDFVFNSEYLIATGLGFGSIARYKLVKNLMDGYNALKFVKDNGKIDLTPCPQINRECFIDFGFKMNNEFQCISNVAVFPYEYFCPKNWQTKEIIITDNTMSIHHFDATWHETRKKNLFMRIISKARRTVGKLIKKK